MMGIDLNFKYKLIRNPYKLIRKNRKSGQACEYAVHKGRKSNDEQMHIYNINLQIQAGVLFRGKSLNTSAKIKRI